MTVKMRRMRRTMKIKSLRWWWRWWGWRWWGWQLWGRRWRGRRWWGCFECVSGRQTGTEGCNWVKSAALRPPSHCHPRQEEDQQDHQQEDHQQDHQEDLEEDLEDGNDLACERQAPASTQGYPTTQFSNHYSYTIQKKLNSRPSSWVKFTILPYPTWNCQTTPRWSFVRGEQGFRWSAARMSTCVLGSSLDFTQLFRKLNPLNWFELNLPCPVQLPASPSSIIITLAKISMWCCKYLGIWKTTKLRGVNFNEVPTFSPRFHFQESVCRTFRLIALIKCHKPFQKCCVVQAVVTFLIFTHEWSTIVYE